jgi:hypothetical protein
MKTSGKYKNICIKQVLQDYEWLDFDKWLVDLSCKSGALLVDIYHVEPCWTMRIVDCLDLELRMSAVSAP